MKKIIGIMTGNSLDACDVVLTEFDGTKIRDLASYSLPSPVQLRNDLLKLRQEINTESISMEELNQNSFFIQPHDSYIQWVASAYITTFLIHLHCWQPNEYDKRVISVLSFKMPLLRHKPFLSVYKN